MLGRNNHGFARHGFNRLADNTLGAVTPRGVEKIDAEIQRPTDQRNRGRVTIPRTQTGLRITAAAESRHADLKARPAKFGVLHVQPGAPA